MSNPKPKSQFRRFDGQTCWLLKLVYIMHVLGYLLL